MNKYEARQTLAHARFFSTFFGVNKEGATRPTIRFWRFASIVGMHLLFVLSFWVDIQILEGDITGSRFVGFHLADPYVSLQVFLARHEFATNLIIGMSTILAFYVFIAGRAFCSWVCPYNLFSEFAERLNAKLVAKGVVKCHDFDPRVRYVFFVAFLLASFVSGFLVFEIVSVTGIVSRFIIYGYSAAIWWAVLVFVTEVFYSRRFWCRYVCPIGTLYSLVSRYRAVKISWEADKCDHCHACSDVCLVPKVLEITKMKKGEVSNLKLENGKFSIASGDCTLCGRCVDVCHQDALAYENRLKKLL